MPTETFPARLSSLHKISEFAVRAAAAAGLSDEDSYAVELAVDEACNNIIEHAYGGEGKGEIVCTTEVSERGLKVILHDHGRPFDPTEVPEPNLNTPLKDLPVRGAGLFLMRKMMDDVRFEFDRKKGNTLIMVKYRDKQGKKV